MAAFGLSIPMEMQALQMLTIFPLTGWAGANLYATEMPFLSLVKAASYVVGLLTAGFIGAIYPSIFSYIFWGLMKIGQWYIFDAVDIMDPAFKTKGFRSPFHLPLPSFLDSFSGTIFCATNDCGKSGKWVLTLPLLLIIIAAFSAYGFTWANQLPTAYQAYMQYLTGGGSALLASGGYLSPLFSPQTATSLLASQSIGAAGTPAGITVPNVPGVSSLAQLGGGKGLPSISSFAKEMEDSYSEKAFDDSSVFLSILAYICAAGFGLAVARRIQV